MAFYRFDGDDERYYPTLGLTVKPGDVVEFTEDAPDESFVAASKPEAKPAADTPNPEPAAPAAEPEEGAK